MAFVFPCLAYFTLHNADGSIMLSQMSGVRSFLELKYIPLYIHRPHMYAHPPIFVHSCIDGQRVTTFSYQMNNGWGSDVQHGDYS